jgi:hypothetical protein
MDSLADLTGSFSDCARPFLSYFFGPLGGLVSFWFSLSGIGFMMLMLGEMKLLMVSLYTPFSPAFYLSFPDYSYSIGFYCFLSFRFFFMSLISSF